MIIIVNAGGQGEELRALLADTLAATIKLEPSWCMHTRAHTHTHSTTPTSTPTFSHTRRHTHARTHARTHAACAYPRTVRIYRRGYPLVS